MDKERLGILGHSRGGGNSLIFTLEHPQIKSVTIWNSIPRPDFFGDELIREIKEKGRVYITNARTKQEMPIDLEVIEDLERNWERFNFIKRLSTLTQPLLIVQADQDHPGFMEGAQQIFQQAPRARLEVISNANHTFRAVHPFTSMTPQLNDAINLSVQFFQETLTG
jgi:pimeloyl-ACP methyl ester carboxylesterase